MSDVAFIVLDATGGGAMLRTCIDSIRGQSVAPAEIVVLDNGSPRPIALDGARVIRSETNLGFAAGVNEAWRQTESEFVALVNNDVTLDRDWLALVLQVMHIDRKAAAVQTIIRRDAQTIDGAGIDISDGTYRQIGHGMPIGTPLPPAWGVSATAALYRRAAVGERVFDPSFFAYYEDVDLSARLHEEGWTTVVLPIVKATHLGSHSAPLLGWRGRYLRTRNRYRVARRHRGIGSIPALLWEDARRLARSARRPPASGQIVVVTPDVVGRRMAGPGIRAWNLARELARHFPTALVASVEDCGEAPFDVVHRKDARELLRRASVLIGQPARGFHRMRRGQRIVYDLFDPVLLELEVLYGPRPSPRQRAHVSAERWRIGRALREGDLLICATSAQRELYRSDRMIEVPFGVDLDEVAPPVPRENLVLWGGGTWEWLDPRTAIDAVLRVNDDGLPCRLLFLGRRRPHGDLAALRIDALLGGPIEANDAWVPYAERLSWLRRAKIAMMLHRSTAEARYSIRTRLFDAIAAATPVIATEEGFAAELVAKEGLGIVVPPSDVNAVVKAVHRLLEDDAFHAQCVSNLERIRPRFAWPEVVRPLIETVSRWQTQS